MRSPYDMSWFNFVYCDFSIPSLASPSEAFSSFMPISRPRWLPPLHTVDIMTGYPVSTLLTLIILRQIVEEALTQGAKPVEEDAPVRVPGPGGDMITVRGVVR
jgi:hypothetical protein